MSPASPAARAEHSVTSDLSMTIEAWSGFLAMAATVAFAVTAVLAIKSDKEVDLFAATVLGLITAIGGGTIRDVILDAPVFWAADLSYIWVACVASVLAFYGRKFFSDRYVYAVMLYVDGFGAAMFGIQGAGKVWDLGFGLPVAPVILGIVTAIGGGLIRDVLAGRTTLLMKPELYAVPVCIGCVAYVFVLEFWPEQRLAGSIVCILVTFALRAAAIRWNLSVPGFARLTADEKSE